MAPVSAPKPEDWARQQAIVLRNADADVVRLLREAQADIVAQMKAISARPLGRSGHLREAQLRLVQRNLQLELGRVFRRLGNLVEARRAEAAARAISYGEQIDAFKLYSAGVSGGVDVARAIADAEADSAASGLDRMIARTTGASYQPLSTRVYLSESLVQGKIDRLVNSALARGLSAKELADEVRQYINPLTPGGLRYSAMRLARTEINNAAHAVAIHAQRDKPWVEGMKWNLSGSHGRPDICDQLARGGPKGDGIYPVHSVPSKPHPQCFCFPTPETVDEDEFNDRLLAGEYNSYLDRYRGLSDLPEGQVIRSDLGGFSAIKHAPAPKLVKPPAPPAPKIVKAPPTPKPAPAAPPKPRVVKPSPVTPAVKKVTPTPGRTASPAAQTSSAALRQKNLIPGENGKIIQQVIEKQAGLVPGVMQHFVDVNIASFQDLVASGTPDALGWYDRRFRKIRLNREVFTDAYKRSFKREIETNWGTDCGAHHTAPQSIFNHEFGHHVDAYIRKATPADLGKFWTKMSDLMGLERPDARQISKKQYDSWFAKHKGSIESKVSRYGATSPGEMFAEIWQEYSSKGASARPHIKAIGDLMKELAEKNAR